MSRNSLKRRVLRRPSPALVVAMIALVVASAGVANGGIGGSKLAPTAAAGPFITGAHVLDKSLTGADIADHSLTPTQFSGSVQGPAGPAGPTGPAGPFPSGNMPAGVTLRGNYGVGGQMTAASGFAWEGVSYLYQMRVAPVPHFIPTGTTPPAGCPGTPSNPQATSGNLCVYEASASLINAMHIFKPEVGGTDQAGLWGFGLWLTSSAAGNAFSYGSWAATSS